MRPTAAGLRLLDYARRVHALLEEAEAGLGGDATAAGPLLLAASTTLASYVLPGLLADFLRTVAPGTGVHLEVGNTEEVLGWVREGRVPLGLVEGHARSGGLRLESFLEDALLPVVGASAPPSLARLRRVAQLSEVPLLWREPGSGTRAVVERALRRAGLRRGVQPQDLQLGGTESIKAAAALGLGVAFLSRWSIQAELAQGRLRALPLEGLTIPRHFSWVLPGGDVGGLAGRFLRHARAAAPGLAR